MGIMDTLPEAELLTQVISPYAAEILLSQFRKVSFHKALGGEKLLVNLPGHIWYVFRVPASMNQNIFQVVYVAKN